MSIPTTGSAPTTPTLHPAPSAVPAPTPEGWFPVERPTLARGVIDRSEDLRAPERMTTGWPTARVITVDPMGRVEYDASGSQPRLVTVAADAFGAEPPANAILLGAVDGVDHWAVPVPAPEQNGAPDGVLVPGETSGVTRMHLLQIGALLSDDDAGLLATATALLNWHQRGAFCPRCGTPSTPSPAGWARVCEQGHEEFPRTDPAVIVLVHDGADKMVLARQPIWPPGWVSVLAGFVEAGESLEMTVAREIKEEVGLDVDQITYLTSQPWPAPRSLMLGFAARANPDQPLQPREGEIEQAHWVTREEVRRMLGEEAMDMSAQPTGSAERKMLPGAVSIARKLIEGWAALD